MRLFFHLVKMIWMQIERLRRILSRHIAYQMDNPIIARAFDVLESSRILDRLGQAEYQTEVDNRLRIYVSTVRQLIKEIADEHSENVNPRLAAHAITTMYDQVGRWHQSSSTKADMEVIETYWKFVCDILHISAKELA